MKLLEVFDNLSYRKVISLSIFFTVLLAVPVGVYLSRQQTRISSRAVYEKPKRATEAKASPGPIPTERAVIGRVFPWVGKVGDVVWIQGENFGINPVQKELRIGGVIVKEEYIARWEDTLIEAIIPEGAIQGGTVEIIIGNYSGVESLPYVLYTTKAKVRLSKENGKIIAVNGGEYLGKYMIWTGDDDVAEQKWSGDVESRNGEYLVFDIGDLPMKTMLLFDKQGQLIEYYVDIIAFDL